MKAGRRERGGGGIEAIVDLLGIVGIGLENGEVAGIRVGIGWGRHGWDKSF